MTGHSAGERLVDKMSMEHLDRQSGDQVGPVDSLVMCHNSSSHELVEKPATLEEWKAKAEALWALLDDIDTAGDMFKPEINSYFKYVNNKAEQRFLHMGSDGYRIINT